MSRNEKMKFIRLIEGSELNISDALSKYDVPRSTYYRWKRKYRMMGINGLQDNKPAPLRLWNSLLPEQADKILEYATLYPEYSSYKGIYLFECMGKPCRIGKRDCQLCMLV
jgi:transposase-like protein